MGNWSPPKVSVCIPVYNCEKFIGMAIESVLCQSYKNFELLILNNCSTDNTAAVIRKYDDIRIRTVEQRINIGAAGNWNRSIRESSGKYIKILCADDFIYSDCIAKQVECLESPSNRNVVLTCCRRDVVDASGRKVLTRGFRELRGLRPGCKAIKSTLRAGANLVGEPGAVLFRSKVLPDCEGFDGGMGYVIDLDFWCRLLLRGDIYVYPETLCAYRVIEGSWSMKAADSQYLDFNRLLTKMYQEPQCGLSGYDLLRGRFLAYVNKNLRSIYYRVFSGSNSFC